VAGEVIALVGESGVGKSTAIELISGYYFPNKGKVLIDEYDTKNVGLKSLRENIAIVPQEPVLFNDTIKHNIQYGNPKATEEQIKYATKEAHA
jgi:ABC-type multidrug transport system fused ATPase/permease subunit